MLVPLPPLRRYLLLWHPCITGWLQPEQIQDMIIGIKFWEERLAEPSLFSLAEQRLRRDVITVYRHQRLRKYREELFRLRHNFGTVTNVYNKVAVNTVRLESEEGFRTGKSLGIRGNEIKQNTAVSGLETELNHLPTGLSQGPRTWQTHALHSLCL